MDRCFNVIPAIDGGMFFCGDSRSDDFDLATQSTELGTWVVKLDSLGNILWNQKISSERLSYVFKFAQAPDSSLYLVGHGYHPDTVGRYDENKDLALAKFDNNGKLLWIKYYGGSNYDRNGKISITPHGDLFLGADSYSDDSHFNQNHGDLDVWVLHLDSSGLVLWRKNIGGNSEEQIGDIQFASDGGVYAFMETASDSFKGMSPLPVFAYKSQRVTLVIKLDKMGNYVWNKQMDFVTSHPSSLHLLKNGDLIAVSKTYSANGSISVMKITSDGIKLWHKFLGLPFKLWIEKVELTSDQGYLLVGRSYIENQIQSAQIIKIDSNGRETWSKTLDGDSVDCSFSGFQTKSGEFIISGYTNSALGEVSSQYGYFDVFITKLGIEPFQISAPRVACFSDSILFLSNSPDSLDWYYQGTKVHSGYSYIQKADPNITELYLEACVSKFGITKCDSHLVKILPLPSFLLSDSIYSCLGMDTAVCLSHLQNVDEIIWMDGIKYSCRSLSMPGNYTLTARNSACSITDSLVFLNYPTASFTLSQTNLPCLDEESARFQIRSQEPLNVFWNDEILSIPNYATFSDSLFHLKIEDQFGCFTDTSIKPLSHCDFSCYFPNSFSPNNDGVNDLYAPVSDEYEYYEIAIYDRWGALVFTSRNTAWDGTINGGPAPIGLYLVKIYVVPKEIPKFKPITESLSIHLLR